MNNTDQTLPSSSPLKENNPDGMEVPEKLSSDESTLDEKADSSWDSPASSSHSANLKQTARSHVSSATICAGSSNKHGTLKQTARKHTSNLFGLNYHGTLKQTARKHTMACLKSNVVKRSAKLELKQTARKQTTSDLVSITLNSEPKIETDLAEDYETFIDQDNNEKINQNKLELNRSISLKTIKKVTQKQTARKRTS